MGKHSKVSSNPWELELCPQSCTQRTSRWRGPLTSPTVAWWVRCPRWRGFLSVCVGSMVIWAVALALDWDPEIGPPASAAGHRSAEKIPKYAEWGALGQMLRPTFVSPPFRQSWALGVKGMKQRGRRWDGLGQAGRLKHFGFIFRAGAAANGTVCTCVWGCRHQDMEVTVLMIFCFATITLRTIGVLNLFVCPPWTLLSVWWRL